MADTEKTIEAEGKKKKKSVKLILFLIIALIFGGGAGAASYFGMIKIPFMGETEKEKLPDISETVFYPLPQIIVALGENAKAKHLRAKFTIETDQQYLERIKNLEPRLMDILNTYLRVVEEKELLNPERFQNLQAQMLRRARLVSGEAAVKNILVQEFLIQ